MVHASTRDVFYYIMALLLSTLGPNALTSPCNSVVSDPFPPYGVPQPFAAVHVHPLTRVRWPAAVM